LFADKIWVKIKAVVKTSFQFLLAGIVLLVSPAANTYAQPVTKIAAGGYHSLFLKSDGSLWAMGDNATGELGDGTYSNTNRPEQIVSSNVVTIAAGGANWTNILGGSSLFIKSDGSLWAMGDNTAGELGDGTYNNTNRPEQIVASNVVAIAVGTGYVGGHSLFLKSDGSLWAMGDNYFGELGDGSNNNTNRPEQIMASNVVAIAAGEGHSLFLKNDGSLWGMGRTVISTNRPIQIVASNVVAIAAANVNDLFIENDGSLWGTGVNNKGQIGKLIVTNNVVATAGSAHILFLKSDGSMWGMGENYWGALGIGTYNTNSPYGIYSLQLIVGSGVTAIAAGGSFSLLIKSDGSLWGMGWNGNGELGDGTLNNTNLPELIVAGPMNIASISLAGTNLMLNGINGISGSTNYVLASTDITLPKNQWTPVVTNILNTNGNFTLTLTNAVNPNSPQQFYILQSQ
jgi:regulator of chromosome condensation (RCC1) repeat-containing protein/Regulator of Chromosome Condensation (RCC1) repeat protein